MTHLFYIITGLLAAFELGKAINCRYIHAEYSLLRRMSRSDRSFYLKSRPELRVITIIDCMEFYFLLIGMFSGQKTFYVYVFVFLLMLSRFQRLGPWATCIDSLLTTAAFVLAILCKYNWI